MRSDVMLKKMRPIIVSAAVISRTDAAKNSTARIGAVKNKGDTSRAAMP